MYEAEETMLATVPEVNSDPVTSNFPLLTVIDPLEVSVPPNSEPLSPPNEPLTKKNTSDPTCCGPVTPPSPEKDTDPVVYKVPAEGDIK